VDARRPVTEWAPLGRPRFLLRKDSGLVDAPGRRVVGATGNSPFMLPSRTDRRDRPCNPTTRRRVIVDRHSVAEQADDERPDAARSPDARQAKTRRDHGATFTSAKGDPIPAVHMGVIAGKDPE